MARMPTPWKHPKTGTYWIRLRVPDRLQDKLGKRLFQRTLGTKSVAEAKVLFAEALAELNEIWARLSVDAGRMTRKQRHALAGEYCRWSIARRENDPGRVDVLLREIASDEFCIAPPGKRLPAPGYPVRELMPMFLAERGIPVHDLDMYDLATDCGKAEVLAKKTLLRYAQGDYRKAPELELFPTYVPTAAKATSGDLTLDRYWDAFVKEKKLAPGTQKRWRPLLRKLEKHVGRSDLGTVTSEEIVGWKDALIASGISYRTIAEGHFAAARSFFNWAIRNRKLLANPCAGVTIEKEKVVHLVPPRSRELRDEEAKLILSESLRPADVRASETFAAAKRWVPWLCAFTGARVNEMTQLRAQDILEERMGDKIVYVVRITPAAGSVKNGIARDVVLHPCLIAQGFVALAKLKKTGPLFYDGNRARTATAENPPYKKVGERLARWVREIGVDDVGIDPNHGWRHRYKTVARRSGMTDLVSDGICGHASKSVGDAYGEMPMERKWRETNLLPRIEVQAPTGDLPDSPARRKRNADRAATAERAKTRTVLKRKPVPTPAAEPLSA